MPDWQKLVRQRLHGVALDDDDAAQVVEELAGHLEEDYQYSLAEGAPEQLAIRRALRHVHDWHGLKSQIESSRKKELPMTSCLLRPSAPNRGSLLPGEDRHAWRLSPWSIFPGS